VAVACGVKVLRFSVGFGKTLWRWKPAKQRPNQDTEFVIGAFPLGGYVKMLDEREGPVPADAHLAFNTQPLHKRAAIVAAGPVANLLLAVLLYAVVNWWGVLEPRPVLAARSPARSPPRPACAAASASSAPASTGEALAPVRSFEEVRWLLTRGALDGRDLKLEVVDDGRRGSREVVLALSRLDAARCRRAAVPAQSACWAPHPP
jgi:regulator of sigma E protease